MKKVLLASDGSEYSNDAARLLAHLPHDESLEIVVVSVLNVPATNRTSISRDWIEQCVGQEDARAKESFEHIQSMFEGANATLSHIIEEGHVGSTLVNVATKENPDLFVLGAKGRSTVNRLLLGSVSDYVATHAECSVLIVRPTEMTKSNRPIRVAIAYDPNEPVHQGLDEICEVDWGTQPDVRLISVAPLTLPYGEQQRDFDLEALKVATKQVARVAPNVNSDLIEHDHVGEGLVGYAEQHDCDVIVVSESNRSRLGRFLLGSVSKFVLRHAPCSVWITRTGQPS